MDEETNEAEVVESDSPEVEEAISEEPMTEGEEHRYSEFEDLRDRIESLSESVSSLASMVEQGFLDMKDIVIDSGGVVSEAIVDELPECEGDSSGDYIPLEDMDLSI